MDITTYAPTKKQCGNTRGVTASGHKIKNGMCAADWKFYPPGTIIRLTYKYKVPVTRSSSRNFSRKYVIKNYKEYLVVADTGSAIKGKNKIDVALGVIHYPKNVKVKIVKLGDRKSPYKAVKKSLKLRKEIINGNKQVSIQNIQVRGPWFSNSNYGELLLKSLWRLPISLYY